MVIKPSLFILKHNWVHTVKIGNLLVTFALPPSRLLPSLSLTVPLTVKRMRSEVWLLMSIGDRACAFKSQ
jgi:hypothetical protein